MGLLERFRQHRARRRAAWESYCKRCGLCCYQKEYRRGRIHINLSRPCPYLDIQTMECMVYERRFTVCSDCKKVTLYHALFSSLMPEQCGYVQRFRKWRFLIPVPRISRTRVRSRRASRR